MKRFFILLGLLFIQSLLFAQSIDSVLICKVQFKNEKFNNAHAGSAFLVEYKGKVYGCTAKHVLFFAKTDSMNAVSFGNSLNSWEFVSKTNPELVIKAGKLINEDPEEKLIMPLQNDWLVFEIEGEIPEDLAIYKLRDQPLTKGEPLRFLGYPYNNEKPIGINGIFVDFTSGNNLSLDVPKGVYNGCSGGPVIDVMGQLVGLVSMGYFDKANNKQVFEPASVAYFKEIMENNYGG